MPCYSALCNHHPIAVRGIRQAFSAPHAEAKLVADVRAGGVVEAAVPARSGGAPPHHARSAPGAAAIPSQPPAQMFARPPSPFATGLYAPPPPPLSAAMVAGGQQPDPRSRSAMALAAEVVAANAVLADRARAKQAYATTDRAQVSFCSHLCGGLPDLGWNVSISVQTCPRPRTAMRLCTDALCRADQHQLSY